MDCSNSTHSTLCIIASVGKWCQIGDVMKGLLFTWRCIDITEGKSCHAVMLCVGYTIWQLKHRLGKVREHTIPGDGGNGLWGGKQMATSRAYATMSVSVCLSVTEVHWRIIANLRFKFRSKFTAHCCSGEGSSQQHLALVTCFLYHNAVTCCWPEVRMLIMSSYVNNTLHVVQRGVDV